VNKNVQHFKLAHPSLYSHAKSNKEKGIAKVQAIPREERIKRLKIESHSNAYLALAIGAVGYKEIRLIGGGVAQIDEGRAVVENSRIEDIVKLNNRSQLVSFMDPPLPRDPQIKSVEAWADPGVSWQIPAIRPDRLKRKMRE